MKNFIQTILPRIALYKAMLKSDLANDEVYKYMQKYMIDIIAKQKHSSMVKMEKVPCFYSIYSNIFLKIMRTTDLQESTQKQGRDYYDITIKKCLWHTACVENDCAELCRLFCDVDDVTIWRIKENRLFTNKNFRVWWRLLRFSFLQKDEMKGKLL